MTDNCVDLARATVAQACRVLAHRELAPGFLGHISYRMADGSVLVRCRGPLERGLAHTQPEDVKRITMEGEPAARGELEGGYAIPNEWPLHREVLETFPEMHAVVHAHPRDIVVADLAGLELIPVVGAFDIPGAKLAAEGVPVYTRSVLVCTRPLAQEMVQSMDGHPAVVMRGHGLTTAGATVEQAVLRAISLNTLAGISLQVRAAGGTPVRISEEDLAQLPDLGGAFNLETAWRHELAQLTREP